MKKYLFLMLVIVGIVIYLFFNGFTVRKIEVILLNPANNENNVYIQPTLEWDVKSNYKPDLLLVYEVYLGDATDTMNLIATTISTNITLDISLDFSKKYYWQVKVYKADPENILSTKDSNYIKSSEIYSFTTLNKPQFNLQHKKLTNNISNFEIDKEGNILLDFEHFLKMNHHFSDVLNEVPYPSKNEFEWYLNNLIIGIKVYFSNSNDALKINKLVLELKGVEK